MKLHRLIKLVLWLADGIVYVAAVVILSGCHFHPGKIGGDWKAYAPEPQAGLFDRLAQAETQAAETDEICQAKIEAMRK